MTEPWILGALHAAGRSLVVWSCISLVVAFCYQLCAVQSSDTRIQRAERYQRLFVLAAGSLWGAELAAYFGARILAGTPAHGAIVLLGLNAWALPQYMLWLGALGAAGTVFVHGTWRRHKLGVVAALGRIEKMLRSHEPVTLFVLDQWHAEFTRSKASFPPLLRSLTAAEERRYSLLRKQVDGHVKGRTTGRRPASGWRTE